MTKELQKIKQNEISPLEQAQSFLKGGGDLENLEKMMVLQEKFEERQAKKAYHEAMAAFKADPPKILKDKKVAFKNTKYSHATLAKIVEEIGKALSNYGLSAAWKTDQTDLISVTCTITHILGYSEKTTLKAGPDSSGGKNAIQAIGSTVSYLERYTILALTGLATHDMDDDGQSAEIVFISEKQASTLTDMINEYVKDEKDFLKYVGVESIDQLPVKRYNAVKTDLEALKK